MMRRRVVVRVMKMIVMIVLIIMMILEILIVITMIIMMILDIHAPCKLPNLLVFNPCYLLWSLILVRQ